MSMMGELQFFLELQIKQTPQGTFVHQAKYTKDLLRKFDMSDLSPQPTPISTSTTLDLDLVLKRTYTNICEPQNNSKEP